MWDVLGTIVGFAFSVGFFVVAGFVSSDHAKNQEKARQTIFGLFIALYLALLAILWVVFDGGW